MWSIEARRMTVVAGSKPKRAHIVMPADLIAEIDAEVGPRGRSRYVQEAVEEKLRRQKLLKSLEELAGSLASYSIPGWESSEAAAEWVRALRRGEPVGVAQKADDRAA
jgi:hypothetical protein